MAGKLTNSWTLVKASARVPSADKELLVFPLLSSFCLLVVAAGFLLPLALFRIGAGAAGALAAADFALLFLFCVVQYFLMIFFNSALVGAAQIRLGGGDPTVGDGLRAALARLGPIFGYAVIAASVGLALRGASRRGGAIGKGGAAIGGIGRSLATTGEAAFFERRLLQGAFHSR